MVNKGSSFEQTMMGWSSQCYIPRFVEISPLVPEKKIFEGFFTIYWYGGNLGHLTNMPRTKFRSLYPRRLHIKFGFDRPIGFGALVSYKLTFEPSAQVS